MVEKSNDFGGGSSLRGYIPAWHLRQLAGRRILDSVQAFSVAGRPAYYFGHVTGEVPRTPSRYRDVKQSVTD